MPAYFGANTKNTSHESVLKIIFYPPFLSIYPAKEGARVVFLDSTLFINGVNLTGKCRQVCVQGARVVACRQ